MADHRQILLEPVQQVAADDLHVIKIELHAQVRLADLGDDVGGVLGAIEEIARPVARIDRLDQQFDVFCRGEIGGARKVGGKDAVGGRALVRLDLAGQAVHGAAADRGGVIERSSKLRVPVLLAAGHRGKAELALALAARRIDAEDVSRC